MTSQTTILELEKLISELKFNLRELRTYGLDDFWAEEHADFVAQVDRLLND